MFYIQDPTDRDSVFLRDLLSEACVGATRGSGTYAFASGEGIKDLFADKNFSRFLSEGHYTLVIGMDEITNEFSLNMMERFKKKYEGHLEVKTYVHNGEGSTFHPKFSWFEKEDGGVLVLGSGNLTKKAMVRNREAYSVVSYGKEEFAQVMDTWHHWYDHSGEYLFDLNDPVSRAKGRINDEKLRYAVAAKMEMERDTSLHDELDLLDEVYRKQAGGQFFKEKKKQAPPKKSERREYRFSKRRRSVALFFYDLRDLFRYAKRKK